MSRGTEPVSPEQPVRGLYPTVMFAFSSRVIWEMRADAFVCAAAQEGVLDIGAGVVSLCRYVPRTQTHEKGTPVEIRRGSTHRL